MVKSRLAIALAIGLLSAGLRFYGLDDWSFANDETTTLVEEGSLFRGLDVPEDSQEYRLPRIIPLSYLIHHVGYSLFGMDEGGSRAIVALFGTLHVLVLFLLLDDLLDRATALSTSLLVALWPQHIFLSQCNRFYLQTAFFVTLGLLLGARAIKRNSAKTMLFACLSVAASILCHAPQGLILGVLLAATVAAFVATRRKLSRPLLGVIGGTMVASLLYLVVYLRPMVSGWNAQAEWGYGPAHSIMAALNSVGWPVALLIPVGAAHLYAQRTEQSWYWLTCALCWGGMVAILPFLLVYHPEYAFPLEFAAFLMAGAAIGHIYHRLAPDNRFAAVAWIALICLPNLPSVVSNFLDGSRFNYKAAAGHIEAHWSPGDRAAAMSPTLLAHYLPKAEPVMPLSRTETVSEIGEALKTPGRVWVVVHGGRPGMALELQRWASRRCVLETTIEKKRFDYYGFFTTVMLCSQDFEVSAVPKPAGLDASDTAL